MYTLEFYDRIRDIERAYKALMNYKVEITD